MFNFDDNFNEYGDEIINLGETILGKEDFRDLYNFHKNTWGLGENAKDYAYRVYASNSTFNMNEVFRNIYRFENIGTEEETKLEQLRNTTFVNQNGLFCSARKLVDFYRANNRFPKILIVFDYVDIGEREIADTLYKLEDIIFEMLNIKNIHKEYIVRDMLYRAIDIELYIKGSRRPIVPDKIYNIMKVNKNVWTNDFNIFVLKEYRFLKCIGSVQNKNYLPLISIKQNDNLFEDKYNLQEKWSNYVLNYNRAVNYIWIKKENFKQIMTGRITCKRLFVLPMYLFGEIDKMTAIKFVNLFKVNNDNSLIQILNDTNEKSLPMQLQLALCLLSYASFCDFLNEYNITDEYSIDIERICMNFGLQSELLEDLKNIFSLIRLTKLSNGKMFYEQLLNDSNELLSLNLSITDGFNMQNKDFSRNIFNVEDYLYETAYKGYVYESQMRESNGVCGKGTPRFGYSSLETFIKSSYYESDLKTLISTLLLVKDGIAESDIDLSQKGTVRMLIKSK